MVMTIAAVIVFTGIGLFCIIWRADAARWFGLAMGARFPAGCMAIFGLGFILVAIAFIVLYQQGILSTP